jgi:hypothetical protein
MPRGPGRPCKRGERLAGRAAGTPNKHTAQVRWVIGEVARQLGGVDRLVQWAQENRKNEFAFWTSIYPRLLPLQVEGSGQRGEIDLNVQLTPEELDRRLEERGLPRFVFGTREVPLLQLEAVKPNRKDTDGNGTA